MSHRLCHGSSGEPIGASHIQQQTHWIVPPTEALGYEELNRLHHVVDIHRAPVLVFKKIGSCSTGQHAVHPLQPFHHHPSVSIMDTLKTQATVQWWRATVYLNGKGLGEGDKWLRPVDDAASQNCIMAVIRPNIFLSCHFCLSIRIHWLGFIRLLVKRLHSFVHYPHNHINASLIKAQNARYTGIFV